jgi:hypothetical protein
MKDGVAVNIRKSIPFIVLIILLSAARAVAADPQIQLTPEKKKALLKFDPVDIVPEVRGNDSQGRDNQGDRGRRRTRQNTSPSSAAVVPAAPTPTATPRATATAKPTSTPTPTPAPATQTKPQPTQSPTQSAVAMARSTEPASGAPVSGATAKPSNRARRMPLPVIFLLLGLIMVALVAVAAKLKKDLRRP